jgi:hypothetical protein
VKANGIARRWLICSIAQIRRPELPFYRREIPEPLAALPTVTDFTAGAVTPAIPSGGALSHGPREMSKEVGNESP